MNFVKLKDLCDVRDGTHDSPKYIESGGFPLVTSKNIVDGKLDLSDVNYISEDDYNAINKRSKVDKDDIIMPMIGTIGNPIIIGDFTDFAIKNVALIKQNSDVVLIEYIYYFLTSEKFVRFVSSKNRGGTQKFISLSDIRNIEVPVVSESEQKVIIHKLNTINTIINCYNQQLLKCDELIKSRFVEMFGDMVLNPYCYNVQNLGNVCDVRDGTHDSPQYYLTGFPLVTSKNITQGKIVFDDCNLISKKDYENISKRSKVDIGDIIMPMIGTVGKPVIVETEKRFAIKNVALIKFNSESKLNNVFVRELLQSNYFDIMVLNKVRGGTQKFIALGDIRKLRVCIPPMELQNQFADFVTKVEQQKSTVQKSIEKLETLKKSLMQEYFG